VEAIGVWPFRARAKRRKASAAGEAAGSAEAQIPLVPRGVMATGWLRQSLVLPSEVCWVPRER